MRLVSFFLCSPSWYFYPSTVTKIMIKEDITYLWHCESILLPNIFPIIGGGVVSCRTLSQLIQVRWVTFPGEQHGSLEASGLHHIIRILLLRTTKLSSGHIFVNASASWAARLVRLKIRPGWTMHCRLSSSHPLVAWAGNIRKLLWNHKLCLRDLCIILIPCQIIISDSWRLNLSVLPPLFVVESS
jgi:hypothetical protein